MKNTTSFFLIILTTVITSCVQETQLKTIIFKVDFSKVQTIDNPSVKGQFTNPSWEKAIPLTDENNDNIYEAKVEFEAAQYGVQFKFENNGEYELEGRDNRFIKLKYMPETIHYETVFDNPEGQQKQITN